MDNNFSVKILESYMDIDKLHDDINKNHSFIEDSVMQNALASFANRPILGYVHQLDD